MKTRLLCTVLMLFASFGWSANPGWLGLGVTYPAGDPSAKRFLFVQHVLAGSPADQAGIRPQDLITAIDGKPVAFADRTAMLHFFRGLRVAQRVRLTLVRGARSFTVSVRTIDAPPQYAPLLQEGKR